MTDISKNRDVAVPVCLSKAALLGLQQLVERGHASEEMTALTLELSALVDLCDKRAAGPRGAGSAT